MRKKLFLIVGISFILFAGCKQLLADIEKDLDYWLSSVHIVDTILPPFVEDVDGYPCVPSNDDTIVTLKLVNPQNYILKTPGDSGAPSDMVVFESGVEGSGGAVPVHGIDYEFQQTGPNEVKFIYKKAFLEKSEWGRQNLTAAITLYNKEGRRFGTHSFKLRANSRLPSPKGIALLKTKNPDGGKHYYVLCFRPEDIDKRVNGSDFLHKDLSEVHIQKQGNEAFICPLKFNASNTGFDISGASGVLINLSDAEKLDNSDCSHQDLIDPVPADSWVICLKTDIPVVLNSPKITYNVRLKDEKGFLSPSGTKTTNTFKPPAPTISFSVSMNTVLEFGVYTPVGKPNNSTDLLNGKASGQPDGSSEAKAIPIYSAYGENILLDIKFNITSIPSNSWYDIVTSITPLGYEAYNYNTTGNGTVVQYDVELKLNSDEAVYRLDTSVQVSDLEDGDVFSIYYKVIRGVNGNTSDDVPVWGILKKAVEKTGSGGTLMVRGEVKATDFSGGADNHGEIEINKDITIRGGKGSQDDILNANYGSASGQNHAQHRIFKVLNSGNLTIKGLTLKGADSGSENGGAIYTEGTVKMIDCDIKDNEAALGDALYIAENGSFIMKGSAKVDENNDVYLSTNKTINISGELTPAGGTAALIIPERYPSGGENIRVLAGDISIDENYKKFKVKSNGGTSWYVGSDGNLTTDQP